MPAQPTRIGSYEIVKPLGHGGMGTVFLARDPGIDRLVAIKLLRDGMDEPELRERFAREARSAGRLRHPNIVTIFHIGNHESQPYIAMEYIPGQTLADIIQERHPLRVSRKLKIIEDLCSGLAYAHRAGVVHRDIKPANIVVDSDGLVKILDFGIARAGEQSMTRFGTVMGTPRYMAPEQLAPGTADARSDGFAVGLVLYELLTFEPAFTGDTFVVMNKILREEPEPIERFCPGIDPAIVAIVKKALAKDPLARYQELGAMRAELARVGARLVEDEEATADDETAVVFLPSGPPVVVDVAETIEAPSPPSGSAVSLELASAALEAGEFQRVIDLCAPIAAHDANHERAAGLIDAARRRLAHAAARVLVDAAGQQLAQGNLEAAKHTLDKATALDLPDDASISLRSELGSLRDALAQAEQRVLAVRHAVAEAREHMRAGLLDEAARSIARALSLEPGNAEALDADLAVRSARDAAARELAAVEAMMRARALASSGEFEAAVQSLQPVLGDPRVPDLVAEIETQQREVARAEDEQRRRRHAEAVRAEIARARVTAEAGDPAAAVARLTAIRFDVPDLASDAVSALQSEADGLIARYRASVSIGDARREAAANRFAEAGKLVERARALDATHPELGAVEREIADAVAREAAIHRRRQLDALLVRVAVARETAEKGDPDAALGALREIQWNVPELAGDDLARLHADADRLAAHYEATRCVEAARRELTEGTLLRATELLERARQWEPAHPGLNGLAGDIRVREDAERARAEQERVASEQRRKELASLVSGAEAAIRDGDLTTAEERLRTADGIAPNDPALAAARATLATANAERQAAEAARRELEARRVEHERQLRAQLAEARSRLAQHQPQRAVQLLEDLQRTDHGPVPADVLSDIDAVMSTARLEIQVQGLAVEARRHLKDNALPTALERVDQAVALDSQSQEIRELRDQIRAAIAAKALREREAEEQRRLAAEQQEMRERQQQVAAALKRAKKTKSPEDAIAILSGALLLDPGNKGCLDLLAVRQAELVMRGTPATPRDDRTLRFDPALNGQTDKRWRSVGVAAAVGVALLLAVWGVVQWRRSEPQPASTTVALTSPTSQPNSTGAPPSPPPPVPPDSAPAGPNPGSVGPNPGPVQPPPVSGKPALTSKPTVGPVKPPPTGAQQPANPGPPTAPPAQPTGGGGPSTSGSVQPSGGAVQLPSGSVQPTPGGAQQGGGAGTEQPRGGSGQPPTVQAPPPPTAPVQPTNLDADRQAIQQVLNQYAAAYSARDAAAVARLVPSGAPTNFGQYRSYKLTLSGVRIELEGDTATVTCVRQIDAVVSRGNQTLRESPPTTISLRRSGSSWTIDSVK